MSHAKRDFAQVLKDHEGNDVRLNAACDPVTLQVVAGILAGLPADIQPKVIEVLNKGLGKPLTLSRVCCVALGQAGPDERSLGGDVVLKRYKLGMRLKEGMVKLSADDIVMAKDCVRNLFPSPVISAQVAMLLEGESLEASEPLDDAETEA